MRGSVHILLIVLAIALKALGNDSKTLYENPRPANTSDSLLRIRSVPLQYFEFKYSSVPGRRQLGVIGPDALQWLPDSVEVSDKTFLLKTGRVVVPNYPDVDSNVVFMHSVAALQEMLKSLQEMEAELGRVQATEDDFRAAVRAIEAGLNQEISTQLAEKLRIAETEAKIAEKERELESNRKQNIEAEVLEKIKEEKILLEYEASLAKTRIAQEEALAREIMNKKIELERSLMQQREKYRVEAQAKIRAKEEENLRNEAQRKLDVEKEKIRAETEAKAQIDRENEESALRKMQLQAKLDTEQMVQTVQTIGTQISKLLMDLISRPQQLLMLLAGVVVLMAVYYLLREMVRFARAFIQSKLGKPSLVRETSMEWAIKAFFMNVLGVITPRWRQDIAAESKKVEEFFQDVILSSEDRERVVQLSVATRNTKRTGAPYRHVLLHGPPGTGKTLIARRLARCSGMDYAIMSGGDVGPLGEDAVSQLHGLFKWASRSRRGLLLFIDEAEAFLSSRSSKGSTEDVHLRHALNALLYQTGTQSRTFMLVLATNRPQDLDNAILDRMDISIKIDIPGLEQRAQLLKLYAGVHLESVVAKSQKRTSLFSSNPKVAIEENCFEEEFLKFIAGQIDGFSGREISKLMISAQYAMMLAPEGLLTRTLFERVLTTKLSEHMQRKVYSHQIDPSSAMYLRSVQNMDLSTMLAQHQPPPAHNTAASVASYSDLSDFESVQASVRTPRRRSSRKL